MSFSRFSRFFLRGLAGAALFSVFAAAPAFCAPSPANSQQQQDSHLVSPLQMQQQVQSQAATRQQQIDQLNQFLATPAARRAMKDAKIDPVQVRNAVPTLSDAELASLSSRAAHAQQDFAAGHLSVLTLSLIIVAVVILILVIAYH